MSNYFCKRCIVLHTRVCDDPECAAFVAPLPDKIENLLARVGKWMGFARLFVNGGNPVISQEEWNDILELRTAVKDLRLGQHEDQGVIAVWRGRTERAEARAYRYRAALAKYGLHMMDCDKGRSDPDTTCTCGLDAATEDS